MALFQFLVAKLGIPAVAFFAGTKVLKAWKDQKSRNDCRYNSNCRIHYLFHG